MWRLTLVGLGLVVLAAGCSWNATTRAGSGAGSTSPPVVVPQVALTTYRTSADNGYRLRLRYPATWRRYDWQVVTSFTDAMAYLSTGRELPPCKTTHPGGSTEIACHPPIRRLAPGELILTWTGVGFPEPRGREPLAGIPGRLVRLSSGWLEKVSASTSPICSEIGATAAVTAGFARPTDGGVRYEMQACMRAPDIARHTQEVRAMLRDVRFVPS
jgi:hypothetical protein